MNDNGFNFDNNETVENTEPINNEVVEGTPVEPTEPVETTQVTPVTPAEPTAPVEPVAPVQPVQEVTPEVPAEPVAPVAPEVPAEPVVPAEQPAQTTQPEQISMETKKKGSVLPVILIVLFLLIIGGCLVYVFFLKDKIGGNTNNTTTKAALNKDDVIKNGPNNLEEYLLLNDNNYSGLVVLDDSFKKVKFDTSRCGNDIDTEVSYTDNGINYNYSCSINSEGGYVDGSVNGYKVFYKINELENIIMYISNDYLIQYMTTEEGVGLIIYDKNNNIVDTAELATEINGNVIPTYIHNGKLDYIYLLDSEYSGKNCFVTRKDLSNYSKDLDKNKMFSCPNAK